MLHSDKSNRLIKIERGLSPFFNVNHSRKEQLAILNMLLDFPVCKG